MDAIHWCFLQSMASTSQFQATNLQLINDEQNTETHPKTHTQNTHRYSTRKLDPANYSKNVSVAYLLGGLPCFVSYLKKKTCLSHNVGTWRQKSLRVSACFVSLCQLHQAPKDLHHKPGVPKNTLPANGQDFFGLKS